MRVGRDGLAFRLGRGASGHRPRERGLRPGLADRGRGSLRVPLRAGRRAPPSGRRAHRRAGQDPGADARRLLERAHDRRHDHDPRLKAIRFGRLIDGKGHTIQDALVLVEGDRIRSVGAYAKASIPQGAEQFDFTRLTGIPGLIDVHTHMTYWWDRAPGSRPWQELEARPAMQTLYLAEENARRTLETGVTTVRDLGSFQYMDISMRDLINRGAMVGPRMFVAGYGLFPPLSPLPDPPQAAPGGNPHR